MATLSHRFFLRLSQLLLYAPGKAYFGFAVDGADHLPKRGGAVLCANHTSFLDPIVLQAPFRRPIRYLMSAEYYDAPRYRWVSRVFEAIRVDGESANIAALKAAGAALEAGDVVGLFPEGGISRDGRLQAFRSGAAVLALRHGVPLVPAWIEGTSAALPWHARRITRAGISLSIGGAIAVARAGSATLDSETVAALTGRLREAVAALSPSRDRIED